MKRALGQQNLLSPVISQFAPAKINLYLHVTGKRSDGYHTLDSLIVFADVGDQIEVTPADDLSLSINGPYAAGLDAGKDNLVLQAARELSKAAHIKPGAKITLTKNLPVASGIGGGSADAAATLVALSKLWQCKLEKHSLKELSLSLGADVPICLEGQPSFVGGIGEKIAPAPLLPETWVVLVNPGVAVSTPTIFKTRQGPFTPAHPFTVRPKDSSHLSDLLKERNNDLTSPAISLTSVIRNVLGELASSENCLLARMSGSGATCFGLYKSEGEAKAAEAKISGIHKAWWCVATRLLPRK